MPISNITITITADNVADAKSAMRDLANGVDRWKEVDTSEPQGGAPEVSKEPKNKAKRTAKPVEAEKPVEIEQQVSEPDDAQIDIEEVIADVGKQPEEPVVEQPDDGADAVDYEAAREMFVAQYLDTYFKVGATPAEQSMAIQAEFQRVKKEHFGGMTLKQMFEAGHGASAVRAIRSLIAEKKGA